MFNLKKTIYRLLNPHELTKDDLDVSRHVVKKYIKSFNKEVYFRKLSAKEILDFNDSVKANGKKEASPKDVLDVGARLLSLTLANKRGGRIYQDNEIPLLANLPMETLVEMVSVAFEMMNYTPAAINEVKENLKNAPTDSLQSK